MKHNNVKAIKRGMPCYYLGEWGARIRETCEGGWAQMAREKEGTFVWFLSNYCFFSSLKRIIVWPASSRTWQNCVDPITIWRMPLLTGLSDENFLCLKLYIVKVSGQNGFYGFVDQIVRRGKVPTGDIWKGWWPAWLGVQSLGRPRLCWVETCLSLWVILIAFSH